MSGLPAVGSTPSRFAPAPRRPAAGRWASSTDSLGRQTAPKKAKVAIARKLLITVWHVLANGEVDRFATDEQVACSFFALAYKLQVKNLPDGMSALQFTRHHLDRLGIGQGLTHIRWGSKVFKLPPSGLAG